MDANSIERTSTDDRGANRIGDGGLALEQAHSEHWQIGTLSYTRLTIASLFGWLLCGDFAWQMRERAVGTIATLMLKMFGASDSFVGLMMNSVPSALGMVVGPVVNTISDSYRSLRGRRIPFLLVPIPFAVAALIGLAFTPTLGAVLCGAIGGHSRSLSLCRLIVFGVLWTVFEVSAIVTNGIYNALVNDVVPHALIGRFFGAFRVVSLAAGIVFNAFMIGHAEAMYREMFIGLALLYGVGMFVVCMKVKEGDYGPPPEVDRTIRNKEIAATVDFFRETFSMPFYRWFYCGAVLASLTAGAAGTYTLFFAKSLGISNALYGEYTAVMYSISFSVSFLWGYLADRFHPLRVVIGAVTAYTIVALFGGLFIHSPKTFAVVYIATGVINGCLLTVTTPNYQMIFPRSRFGAFSSAVGLAIGLSTIVTVPSIGMLLDATNHEYRLSFLVSGFFGVLAVAVLLVFHSKFMARGGPKGYVAPE